MLSIGEIARRDGVSKPAVSRKVKNLAAKHGLSVERDEKGRVLAVNVAQYDHLRGKFDDPSKAQAPTAPKAVAATDETYDEALRQKTWTEAERSRLRLEEERGNLVRREKFAGAGAKCGELLVPIIKRLVNKADEFALICEREGSRGLMLAFKAFTDSQCNDAADAIATCISLTKAETAKEEAEPADEPPDLVS